MGGASPILAILLIVVITLVLAGAVVFVVFQYMNWDTEAGDSYLFRVDLKGSDDTLIIELLENQLNTSRIIIKLDGVSLNNTSSLLHAGKALMINTGIDIVQGHTYRIIIVVDDNVMYDNDVTAKP